MKENYNIQKGMLNKAETATVISANNHTKDINCWTIQDNKLVDISRTICKEISLGVYLNDKKLISIICYPSNLLELVIGYLSNERIIKNYAQIQNIEWNDNNTEVFIEGEVKESHIQNWKNNKQLLTGCGGGVSAFLNRNITGEDQSDTSFKFGFELIKKYMKQLQNHSDLYKMTHCVHSCAIADKRGIIYFAEDIGRHNAVDKVIGMAILNGDSLSDKILLCTGRFSSEMAFKAISHKIPMIVSRSAITLSTLSLAKKALITVIGFSRGNKIEIYSYPGRVLL